MLLYIELDTTNPNPIFRIMIHYTKHTNNAKMLSIFWRMLEKTNIKQKMNCLFCNMYTLHNSYFVFLGFFVNFVIWGFLYFLILRLQSRSARC